MLNGCPLELAWGDLKNNSSNTLSDIYKNNDKRIKHKPNQNNGKKEILIQSNEGYQKRCDKLEKIITNLNDKVLDISNKLDNNTYKSESNSNKNIEKFSVNTIYTDNTCELILNMLIGLLFIYIIDFFYRLGKRSY